MNEPNKKLALLDHAPVPKALLALGLPTMVGMMINALYNLVDAYFVSGLGVRQMGAISVAYPLGQVVVGLGLLFGNGAASCLSRLLGRQEMEKANKVASTALYSSILVGAILIVGSVVFLEPLLELLGATESALPYAVAYARIYVTFSIFNVCNVTLNNIVSSEGAAKTTMCVLLAGAGLNVILDPIFIYGLDLGVAGAAIATALSQMASTLIYLGYILRKKSVFRFCVRDFCPSRAILSEILKIGVPTLAFQVLTSLSIALTNSAAKEYGDCAQAAMGAVTKLMSVGSLMVFGFLKGLQPVAGYSYGAKKYGRLLQAVRTSVICSTVFCAAFGFAVVLFASPIIGQFAKEDPDMLRIGQAALRASGASFVVFRFYTVYSSLFLAIGRAKAGLFLGICRQGICFLPVILILPSLWGLNGILWVQPVSDVISAALALVLAVQLHRDLERLSSSV